jgi:hypothetical protein
MHNKWGATLEIQHGEAYKYVERATCGVCGTEMTVERSKHIYGKWFGGNRIADMFHCPNNQFTWHIQANKLWYLIQNTPSHSLANIYSKDLREIVAKRKSSKRFNIF